MKWPTKGAIYVLLASVVLLRPYFIVVEVTRELNSNLVSLLRILGTNALLDDFSSDTHLASEAGVIVQSGSEKQSYCNVQIQSGGNRIEGQVVPKIPLFRERCVPRAVGFDICFEALGTRWLGCNAQIPVAYCPLEGHIKRPSLWQMDLHMR